MHLNIKDGINLQIDYLYKKGLSPKKIRATLRKRLSRRKLPTLKVYFNNFKFI